MSKKQRRNISQGTRSNQPIPSGTAGADEATAVGSSISSSSTASSTRPFSSAARRFSGGAEFNPDYSHVVSDVKRIGIIAVSYFVILVALSLILNR